MKESTNNHYNKSLNKSIDFINKNLGKTISIQLLSEIAGISEYHFHRIFKAFIGESLGSFIQRLKMEYAAQKLHYSNLSLEDIALETGYENQQSLSRAFKNYFGINPSAFRNIESYFGSKIKDKENLYIDLNPRIEEIEQIELIYVRIIAKYGEKNKYKESWDNLISYAGKECLIEKDSSFIGLSFDDPNITKENRCRYYACISVKKSFVPAGKYGKISVPAGKFAVFSLNGSYTKLNSLYNSIYRNWLQKTNYELRNSLSFEKYLNNPENVSEKKLKTEVYIPIK